MIGNQFVEYSIAYEKDLKNGDINQLLAERQTCVEALHRMHAFAQKHPQQAIQTKYMSDKLYRVSSIEPMTAFPRIFWFQILHHYNCERISIIIAFII